MPSSFNSGGDVGRLISPRNRADKLPSATAMENTSDSVIDHFARSRAGRHSTGGRFCGKDRSRRGMGTSEVSNRGTAFESCGRSRDLNGFRRCLVRIRLRMRMFRMGWTYGQGESKLTGRRALRGMGVSALTFTLALPMRFASLCSLSPILSEPSSSAPSLSLSLPRSWPSSGTPPSWP